MAGRPSSPRGHRAGALLLIALAAGTAQAAGFDDWVREIAASDFTFTRAQSNVPFAPLAWVDAEHYGATELLGPGGASTGEQFHQTTLSEGALLPLPLGPRDILVTGEWLSNSQLDIEGRPAGDLQVTSFSVPVGWLHQQSDQWQLAAFAAPLGHHTSGESTYFEYLGGFFTRYTRNDQLSWLFGVYADVSSAEHFYTPYVGASYIFNPQWTLSAVLPWPALLYAPNKTLLFRLGVSPAGTSWEVDQAERHPRLDFSAWNLGLSAEYALWRNIWVRAEGGWSGFRGFTFLGSDWMGPNANLGATPFVSVGFTYRPPQTMPPGGP